MELVEHKSLSEIQWEEDLNRSLYLHTGDTLQSLAKSAVHEWFLQGFSIQQAIELWLVENPMV